MHKSDLMQQALLVGGENERARRVSWIRLVLHWSNLSVDQHCHAIELRGGCGQCLLHVFCVGQALEDCGPQTAKSTSPWLEWP